VLFWYIRSETKGYFGILDQRQSVILVY